jgi:Holliday junction resolvase|tara:strand:- start:264 stop:674 length:411 start_codon:yes stop_codon:yes gene_type:complete
VVNSNRKGKVGEREVATILRDELGIAVHRNWAEQAARGGVDLIGVPFWAIEIKRAKKYLSDWWTQAASQARILDDKPVLIYKLDRKQWKAQICYCALVPDSHLHFKLEMDLPDWCSIVREDLCLGRNVPLANSGNI